MALTQDDKKWIKGAITEGVVDALNEIVLPRFDEHDKRFDAVEGRLDSLEEDVRVLKDDVRVLKEDVRVLKEDVRTLKDDMRDVKERLGTVEWQIEALTNDIKELYAAIYKKPNPALISESFSKLNDEDKLLIMNDELLKMAKKLKISLPR